MGGVLRTKVQGHADKSPPVTALSLPLPVLHFLPRLSTATGSQLQVPAEVPEGTRHTQHTHTQHTQSTLQIHTHTTAQSTHTAHHRHTHYMSRTHHTPYIHHYTHGHQRTPHRYTPHILHTPHKNTHHTHRYTHTIPCKPHTQCAHHTHLTHAHHAHSPQPGLSPGKGRNLLEPTAFHKEVGENDRPSLCQEDLRQGLPFICLQRTSQTFTN